MVNKKIEFTIEKWDDIKDKYFRLLIPNLEHAINLLQKLGFPIIKDKTGYWIEVNKQNGK